MTHVRRWSAIGAMGLLALVGCRTSSNRACTVGDAGRTVEASIDAPSVTRDVGVMRRVFADRDAIDFASVCVGRESDPIDVIVVQGGTEPLLLTTAVSGRDAGEFAVSAACGATLAPRSFCRVSVTVLGASSGPREASLLLTVGDQVFEVGLTADVAWCDGPTVRPGSLDFGVVLVGEQSAPRTFVVQNLGSGISPPHDGVVLRGVDADQMAITWDSCAGNGLAASASCEVDVVFAPTRAGALTASLDFDGPFATSALLTGVGVAP